MKPRILITGAGSPTAVGLIQTLAASGLVDVHAGDCTTHAGGLYLVPPERRALIPPDDAPELVPDLLRYCIAARVDVVVPTVEGELIPIARHRASFVSLGVEPVVAPLGALERSLDRWKLFQSLASSLAVPRTGLMDERFRASDWRFPLVARPRRRAANTPHQVLLEPDELLAIDPNVRYVAQEFLPGPDYSVEVVGDRDGRVLATVVVERLGRGAPGSLTCRSIVDDELAQLGRAAYRVLGLTYVASVQLRRDRHGRPCVIDVLPRMPEATALVVSAGVELPGLVVASALGQHPAPVVAPVREVGMVRVWHDHFVSAEGLESDIDDLPTETAVESALHESRPLVH